MADAITTQVAEIGECKVRIEAEVSSGEVEHALEHAAGHLAEEMKMPGFRKGKVPAQLVLQRIGREAVMDAALREFLGDWYERALIDAEVPAVGSPDLDMEEPPAQGDPLRFTIEVLTRPKAELADWKGVEAGKPEAEPPAEAIDAEVERLRQSLARLEPVERPAAEGDFVLIDYSGKTAEGEDFEGGAATDRLIELGSERLIEGFGEGLTGASAGDEREIEVTMPEEGSPEGLAGQVVTFSVKVKEVREKQVPDADDEFAQTAGGFDTLAELRADIAEQLRPVAERQAEEAFRRAAVDAVVAGAAITVPEEVARARAEEMWERMEHQLSHQGISAEMFAQAQGKTRDELIEEAREEAEQALRREAVLAAVADAEQLEVSEQDIVEALGPAEDGKPLTDRKREKLLNRLRKSGRQKLLESEIRLRKAADAIIESATAIPEAQAEAREQIWTPEKEDQPESESSGELWTPGR